MKSQDPFKASLGFFIARKIKFQNVGPDNVEVFVCLVIVYLSATFVEVTNRESHQS